MLAEVKMREGSDWQIVSIIDDTVDVATITQISKMAISQV